MSAFSTLLAQTVKINPKDIGIDKPVKNADAAVGDLLTVVYAVAGIVCVIVLIIAGYMYVTSSGEASAVKRAKEMILGGIIGLVVIIMAFTITGFVLGRF